MQELSRFSLPRPQCLLSYGAGADLSQYRHVRSFVVTVTVGVGVGVGTAASTILTA
jgi:hypothetical protein